MDKSILYEENEKIKQFLRLDTLQNFRPSAYQKSKKEVEEIARKYQVNLLVMKADAEMTHSTIVFQDFKFKNVVHTFKNATIRKEDGLCKQ